MKMTDEAFKWILLTSTWLGLHWEGSEPTAKWIRRNQGVSWALGLPFTRGKTFTDRANKLHSHKGAKLIFVKRTWKYLENENSPTRTGIKVNRDSSMEILFLNDKHEDDKPSKT